MSIPNDYRIKERLGGQTKRKFGDLFLVEHKITKELVETIKSRVVRFLKQDYDSNGDGWWIEVNDDVALGKISHTFGNMRMLSTSDSKGSTQPSSKTGYQLGDLSFSYPTVQALVLQMAAFDLMDQFNYSMKF